MLKHIYAEAYQAGYKKTASYLRALGADPATADEISQAAWVRGWERLSQLRDASSVLQWVNTIARRELATRFRQPRFVDLSELCREPAAAPSLDLLAIDLRCALQKCNSQRRKLLEAFLAGHSNRELAMLTGKSLGAIHARMYRARQELREYMHGDASSGSAASTRLP